MLLALHVFAIRKCRAWTASMSVQSWETFRRVETTDQVCLHSPLSPAQEYAFETIIPIVSTYHTGSRQGGILGHVCETRPMSLANIDVNIKCLQCCKEETRLMQPTTFPVWQTEVCSKPRFTLKLLCESAN